MENFRICRIEPEIDELVLDEDYFVKCVESNETQCEKCSFRYSVSMCHTIRCKDTERKDNKNISFVKFNKLDDDIILVDHNKYEAEEYVTDNIDEDDLKCYNCDLFYRACEIANCTPGTRSDKRDVVYVLIGENDEKEES